MRQQPNFNRIPKYTKAVAKCLPLFINRVRGEEVPIGEIEQACGFARHSPNFTHLIKILKEDLRNLHGIVPWSNRRGAYVILTGEQQVDIPSKKRTKYARKQIHKGLKEVSSTPDELLSHHGVLKKLAKVEQLSDYKDAMSEREKRIAAITGKKEKLDGRD